ncbi:hypothetical protein P3T29_003314 [Kitasatospora sp. MAP5-34]|nr:hypothetical protein [Kitasatospora sp. MAP5-34]
MAERPLPSPAARVDGGGVSKAHAPSVLLSDPRSDLRRCGVLGAVGGCRWAAEEE